MGGTGRSSVPLVGFPRVPGAPPVAVERWSDATARRAAVVGGTHAHDFLVLLHVERGRDRCASTTGSGSSRTATSW